MAWEWECREAGMLGEEWDVLDAEKVDEGMELRNGNEQVSGLDDDVCHGELKE